jgi:hypothetical protein
MRLKIEKNVLTSAHRVAMKAGRSCGLLAALHIGEMKSPRKKRWWAAETALSGYNNTDSIGMNATATHERNLYSGSTGLRQSRHKER